MNPFNYSQATDVQSAIALKAANKNISFVAGGTALIDLMKLNVETPSRLIDINSLPFNKVESMSDGSLRIGALVRNTEAANDPLLKERYPLVPEALLAGASPQLRNMATIGGNLMQRTRCYYFRDTVFEECNKRAPGSGCTAIHEFNRMHAVLGTSDHCVATHPSDLCVALAALDAVIRVSGDRERQIPINEFYLTPGDTPQRENVLEAGELITAVDLAPLPFASRSLYLKVRDRASYEFALASVAAAIDVQDNLIKSVRIALGGVATKPWRAYEAEKNLVGSEPREIRFREAAEIALRDAKPRGDNSFKVELAKRVIVRALTTLSAR